MMEHEFYIGWMQQSPPSFARKCRVAVIIMIALALAIALLAGIAQKKFSTAHFEFGTLTRLKGIYFSKPVPSLKVVRGQDLTGHPVFVTIPLVGFGKHGAASAIEAAERQYRTALHGRELAMKGVLLYNDGKLLMQIDSSDHPVDSLGDYVPSDMYPAATMVMDKTVDGEIVDPKCFFGVMKPGEGKPHKDCAARCILGGIPPVLRVVNTEGAANYYLMVGEHGEPINEAVKDMIAQPVTIHASVRQYGDWMVVYVNPSIDISAYSYLRRQFGEANIVHCDDANANH